MITNASCITWYNNVKVKYIINQIFIIMQKVVSITSQGQITIPSEIRQLFGITTATKAVLSVKKNQIVIKPKDEFWSLQGSLKSDVKLTDGQLKAARENFSRKWAEDR